MISRQTYQNVALFVGITLVWYHLRTYVSKSTTSTISATTNQILEESFNRFAVEPKTPIINHSAGLNENDFLFTAHRHLHYLEYHTKSSKSRIEYNRAMGYLEKLIKKEDRPTIHYPPEFIFSEKADDVCSEKDYSSKDAKIELHAPMWLQPWLEPNCKFPPLNTIVTLIFNFANEIPLEKAENLFEDAADCMYREMHMVALVNPGQTHATLSKIASEKLPNMKILESTNKDNTHARNLNEVLSKVTTKYVVLMRNTERFDNFSTIIRLVRDVSIGNAAVVGGTQRNISGHWKAGCYQTKIKNDLIHFEEGYDESENGCMYCDYLSTPFAVKTQVISEYLNQNIDTKLAGDFFYMEFFMKIRFERKNSVFMCVDSMFYTETSAIQTANNQTWLPFLQKYSLSKVTVGFPFQTHVIQFTCSEVGITCSPKLRGTNHCCFLEAEGILGKIVNTLSSLNVEYRYVLPMQDSFWALISQSNTEQLTVAIETKDGPSTLKDTLKIDGFEWQKDKFTSYSWSVVFTQNQQISSTRTFKIRFGNLVLPTNRNPGEALSSRVNKQCLVCFDLLHYYRDLRNLKIWM